MEVFSSLCLKKDFTWMIEERKKMKLSRGTDEERNSTEVILFLAELNFKIKQSDFCSRTDTSYCFI